MYALVPSLRTRSQTDDILRSILSYCSGDTTGHKARGERVRVSLVVESNALGVEHAVKGEHDVFRKRTAATNMQS